MIGVLLFHFGGVGAGVFGVHLFFVISGFLMARVAPGKTPFGFLADRLWRIVPLYLVALALELAVVRSPFDAQRLLLSATLWPGGVPYLNQSWTLSYEMMFYLGCALYLAIGKAAFALVPLLAWCGRAIDHPLAVFVGDPISIEFLGGMLLAYLPRRHNAASLAAALVSAALSSVLLAPLGFDRAVTFGIPALFLVHAMIGWEPHFADRKADALVRIGSASYAIYLVHLTIGRLLPAAMPWPTAAIIALLGGIAFHGWVERPLVARIRRFRHRPRAARPLILVEQ